MVAQENISSSLLHTEAASDLLNYELKDEISPRAFRSIPAHFVLNSNFTVWYPL